MSKKYPGGILSKTAPVPSGPYQSDSASGIWNMEDVETFRQQGIWPTVGNANPSSYIENLFSTFNYVGEGASAGNTVNNGIDLATNGGLVWAKLRNTTQDHYLFDTARGGGPYLSTNTTSANTNAGNYVNGVAYSGSRYVLSADVAGLQTSTNGTTWTTISGNTSTLKWSNVYYLGGRFVAIAPARQQIAHSTDGTTWTLVTVNASASFDRLLFANSRYMLVATNSATTWASADNCATWSSGNVSSAVNGSPNGWASYGNGFVVVGGNYFNTPAYSTDGINWTTHSGSFSSGVTGIHSFPGANIAFIQVGYTTYYYTTNGANWNTAVTGSGGLWFSQLAYAPATGRFYLHKYGFSGGEGSTAYTSTNGTSWTDVGSPPTGNSIPGIGSDGTTFHIGSYTSTYYTSPTGATWTTRTGIVSDSSSTLTTNGRLFIISGNGQFTTNTDVTNTGTWTTTSLPSVSQINYTTTGFQLTNSAGTSTTYDYVSWTFRKQPKFFDIVTYTGNGSAQNISHNLGSTPGCIMVKRTDAVGNWIVWHRSLNQQTGFLNLEASAAASTNVEYWNNTAPTSSVFSVGPISGTNGNGATYVAYIFAHNAGGFGINGDQNVISCGAFDVDGSGNATVELGYEPQWVLMKNWEAGDVWGVYDNMRGMPVGNTNVARLFANSTAAEGNSSDYNVSPTATGFTAKATGFTNSIYNGFIYMAIRRGPMKVPTLGTSVFSVNAYDGGTAGRSFNLGFVPDTLLTMRRNTGNFNILQSRLIGRNYTFANDTSAELGGQSGIPLWDAPGKTISLSTASSVTGWNGSGSSYVNQAFVRAPRFYDVVCYTGTGVAGRTVTHNLTVVPELMIVKIRSLGYAWRVYSATLGATKSLRLNTTDSEMLDNSIFNDTAPTSTVFSVGDSPQTNGSGQTLVAHLFATCPGVSKVGSYTGTGTTLQVPCGFTTGARFVLIKRTDAQSDWYVWDTARGIIGGNDPYLLMNTADAEVTNTDYIDPISTGFELSSTAPAAINASGGTYIFLAIA
jgi:hypothetical protein